MAKHKRKMIGEANSFLAGGFGHASRVLLGKKGRRV
jgi:hypothetical protein